MKLHHFRSVLFALLLVTPWAHAQGQAKPAARTDTSPHTASDMTSLYLSTPTDCGSAGGNQPDQPAYLCSGIILRSTTPGATFYSWSPSPKDQNVGGVSFYYIRKDAKVTWFLEQNGFSLYPAMGDYKYKGPAKKNRLNVICAFPVDAGTDVRGAPAGCALSALGTTGPMCQGIGVYTADQWIARFVATNGGMEAQCGFDVSTGAPAPKVSRGNVNAADAFMQMIYALKKLGATGFANHTELRIGVWPEDWNAQMPIQSFWYIGVYKGAGWANARKDQVDYFNATGEFVPVIKMKLPASQADDFSFHSLRGRPGCSVDCELG